MDLRLSGAGGQFSLDDFVQSEEPAGYDYRKGQFGEGEKLEHISVPSAKPGAALMFENFAAMVGNPDLFEVSVAASERTQEWLDAIWTKALQNERR